MPYVLDGNLSDWTEAERLAAAGATPAGYMLYGRFEQGHFVFALQSPVAIGANTTFWLNTDGNTSTGFKVFGFAAGAEFNVNIGADGVARLYSGDAGQTLVAEIDHAIAADGLVIEFAIPKSVLGNVDRVEVFADVNDAAFLPSSYGDGGYALVDPASIRFDGLLDDWSQSQRIDTPLNATPGYEIYGKLGGGELVLALKSAVAIGSGTTIWLNTDNDTATGYQIFGNRGGAEFNINFGTDGVPRLYSGADGQIFVADLDYGIGPDGKTLEIAIPASLLGGTVSRVGILADINNSVFLPSDYASKPAFSVVDPTTLPQPSYDGQKIAIVYSETSAAQYFDTMSYSQLFMAAQSQAMAAGIPFDVISESDLTNLDLLLNYDALIFPSFRHAPANFRDIEATLTKLVYDHKVSLIAAGDFMTNDATPNGYLSANPYERMQSLFGVNRVGGDGNVTIDLVAAPGGHAVVSGYGGGGAIRTYTGAWTSYFDSVAPGGATVIAQQIVNGAANNGVIGTVTGGRNVHFSTEALLADNNMLGKSIDWVTETPGPQVSLKMSRDSAIVASRNDMDQSQETWDVIHQTPGIYDKLLPILEDWKAQYNFVGSYYINVGLYPPDQQTDWAVSKPYYQQLLAMGNEIGSHSYSHPSDTGLLLPDVITQELLDDRIARYATLLGDQTVCFCPYCVRYDADPQVVAELAGLSVAQINQKLQAALLAPNPLLLPPVDKAILEASFRFQFETSRHVIEDQLNIPVVGAAVPGMPENLETARQIIQYYDYLSGGASMIGAGYPGAFGYLTPNETDKVYIAPNMSFDFTLLGWLGLTAEQAAARWLQEWKELTINSDLPIVVWPWHDYGATEWPLYDDQASPYKLEMFTSFVATAYQAGAEFVTLADLAERIKTFERTDFSVAINGDTIDVRALPQGSGLGTFAIELADLAGKTIQSVAGWYAYDDNSVFLDQDGGNYKITLGAAPADVTHITSIGARAKLVSLTGDGNSLDFTIAGEGKVTVALKQAGAPTFSVSGATVITQTATSMTLDLGGIGTHAIKINAVFPNQAPTAFEVTGLAVLFENVAERVKVADLSIVDPDTDPSFPPYTVTVSDARFEADATGLFLKAGQSIDYETTQTITLTLTATDGVFSIPASVIVQIGDVNEAPTDIVVSNQVAVAVDQTARTRIADLSVIDPDTLNPDFRNNVLAVDDARFEIVDGVLYLKEGQSLAGLGGTALTLTLSATDGALSYSKAIEVEITAAPATNQAPTDIVFSNVADLPENTGTGFKIADIEVIDPDTDPAFRANIVTVSDSRFEIVEGALYLKAGQAIDFEATPTIALTLTASDGTFEIVRPFTVTVLDVNEAATAIVVANLVTLPQDTSQRTRIADLSVTDPDTTPAFRNNVLGVDDARFEILDGVLYLKAGAVLDPVTDATITLTLTATDGALTYSQPLAVSFVATNTAPTDIVVSNLVSIEENTAIRTRIADLAVVDPDAIPAFRNNVLSVSDSRFEIVDDVLYLKAGQVVDYEAGSPITLTLSATDGPLVFSKPVSITVIDVNEAPTDIVVANKVNLAANTTARTKIADLSVVDPDTVAEFRNNQLTVSDARFEIDPVNLGLYLKAGQTLNFQTEPTIQLTLTASDGTFSLQKALSVTLTAGNPPPSGGGSGGGGNPPGGNPPGGNPPPQTGEFDADGLGTFSYQWQRGSVNGLPSIEMAINGTYLFQSTDATTPVRVVVSHFDSGGARGMIVSDTMAFITDAPSFALPLGFATARDGLGKGPLAITDFVSGRDVIDLSALDANPVLPGNQAFAFLERMGTAFSGAAGQLRWFQEDLAGTANDRTIIAGDIDGDRVADFTIELTGLHMLTAADFVL